MVDTSMKEYTAEDLITYKLQRFGVYVAKPKFDIDGTDLFAMLRFESDTGVIFKYCHVQCKYRSLVGAGKNAVDILEYYVEPGLYCLPLCGRWRYSRKPSVLFSLGRY